MNHAAAIYFKDEFDQSTERAAAIASIFGFMNIFSRPSGGLFSDMTNTHLGVRGRRRLQAVILSSQAVFVVVIASSHELSGTISVMVFVSYFSEATCGTSYGIVPYVDPPSTGSVSGTVGAGGNCGAMGFCFAFRQLSYKKAFQMMGFFHFRRCCFLPFMRRTDSI
jgi:MFS transporter, NNP family, nitrate/nitrite transporter